MKKVIFQHYNFCKEHRFFLRLSLATYIKLTTTKKANSFGLVPALLLQIKLRSRCLPHMQSNKHSWSKRQKCWVMMWAYDENKINVLVCETCWNNAGCKAKSKGSFFVTRTLPPLCKRTCCKSFQKRSKKTEEKSLKCLFIKIFFII